MTLAEPGSLPLPPPVLPTAPRLLGISLDLAFRASASLRAASIWVALQALGIVGPVAVLFLVAITVEPEAVAAAFGGARFVRPGLQPLEGPLVTGTLLAVLTLAVLSIESRIVAVVVLAGAAIGRPVSLREAICRSRQTFWRVVRVSLLIDIPLNLVSAGIQVALQGPLGPTEGDALLATAVTTLFGAPVAYVVAGIVLGDVGALESIRRSLRLARARWRLAVLVSVFTTVAQYVLVFGLATGADLLGRAGASVGLGLEAGPVPALVAILLVAVAAIGSLLFTVSALAVAPQVVAFLGLTHDAAGLDRARREDGRPGVRWFSWGVVVGIVLAFLVARAGVVAAGGS